MTAPAQTSLLSEFPVVIDVPVWWGDQDAFGHVNNTIYMRWFESARIAYTGKVGLTGLMAAHGLGVILAAITCNYRRQITFPDHVHVGARIIRIGRTSLTMEHIVVSTRHQAVAADGSATIVAFNYHTQTSHPVPAEVRRAIEAIEGRAIERKP